MAGVALGSLGLVEQPSPGPSGQPGVGAEAASGHVVALLASCPHSQGPAGPWLGAGGQPWGPESVVAWAQGHVGA